MERRVSDEYIIRSKILCHMSHLFLTRFCPNLVAFALNLVGTS